jgi:amidase
MSTDTTVTTKKQTHKERFPFFVPLCLCAVFLLTVFAAIAQRTPFSVVEATIPEMQKALKEKRVTSREIVQQYLARIAAYDSKLHATITVNPNALKEAEQLDRERSQGKLRGPLHGIPIALKDIIHTTDMPTTGGALAFDGFIPPYEATLTKNLRDAGAIIIAKTSLTELANWVAGQPTPMPTNYNAISGHGMNPYDPRRDPRDDADGRALLFPGGSSSGIGTAANFWAANVGTETSGSILTPSNAMMLVGIKPTAGRISRYGVIPITGDQDTPGPMAKTVTDAAILLGALESKSPDPNDSATNRCAPPPNRDYTRFLNGGSLKGARIGVPRASFYESLTAERAKAMQDVIDVLKREGAVVIDPADVPSLTDPDPEKNFGRWNICNGAGNSRGNDAGCSVVLKYGMKRDFNGWLATLGPSAPVKSLTGLREWNLKHERAGAIKYGQSNLDISDEMDVQADRERYEADRAKDIALAATHGIDEVMKTNRLDALLFPGSSGAALAARPGYPSIAIPFAMVPNAGLFPEGFDPKPGPFGITFTGMACSEPRLIELGYAFEQATKRRIPPELP